MLNLKTASVFLFSSIVILIFLLVNLPDNKMHLINCNVGQGDAILITLGFKQILIDGGKDNRVLSCLDKNLPFWDRQIDVVIATHDDDDHIGGLAEVIKRYKVKNLIWNGKEGGSEKWQGILKTTSKKKTKNIINHGNSYNLDRLIIQLLNPISQVGTVAEDNQVSVVSRISYGDFSVILSGDIDTLTEENLISGSLGLGSTVLKVSHHGSRFSTSDKWLEHVNPKVALIGVGKNSFGHPSSEVIERLKGKNVQILRSDEDGESEIVSDGSGWAILNN